MSAHATYEHIMMQKADIMRASVGIDYDAYTTGPLSFDYERLLSDTGYDLETIAGIQARTAVGNTPLVELENLTALARATAEPGKGARIFLKDEAANPSGSFKDRRASLSVHEARTKRRRDFDASSFRKLLTVGVSLNRRSARKPGPAKPTVRRSCDSPLARSSSTSS
jgi:hypothetical protein